MEPIDGPQGEFHHFQLVNNEGEVPLSISVLVHYNQKASRGVFISETPISHDDVIALHEALRQFDGNFIKAFSKK